MEKFTILCAFFADWLLFIFPLYQGKMELMESSTIFAKYQSSTSKKKKVPFFYWLFPPLLFHHYKVTAHKQFERLSANEVDINNFYSFYNKAFAWYFVSYAGFLHAITSTYEICEKFELDHLAGWATLLIVAIVFFTGNRYVDYLCSDKHKVRFIKGLTKHLNPNNKSEED
ncbi:hypothetical protein ACQW5G_02375 [Fructilactobacillus sp. Tb1]|uniref:hypothetical protein n=1 Tax=Fructilactobacillus sp. Tb1 TaxID=3422304 RepID=UPI003D2CE74C